MEGTEQSQELFGKNSPMWSASNGRSDLGETGEPVKDQTMDGVQIPTWLLL